MKPFSTEWMGAFLAYGWEVNLGLRLKSLLSHKDEVPSLLFGWEAHQPNDRAFYPDIRALLGLCFRLIGFLFWLVLLWWRVQWLIHWLTDTSNGDILPLTHLYLFFTFNKITFTLLLPLSSFILPFFFFYVYDYRKVCFSSITQRILSLHRIIICLVR